MKKNCWITPECFLDTDYYIIPFLCKYFNIEWYVLYKDSIPNKKELEKLDSISNLKIIFYRQEFRMRSIKTLFSDYTLFKTINRKGYDIVYAGMAGFPYFHLLSAIMLKRSKVVIAAHNVNTPKGAVNYLGAKIYATFVLNTFKNFHTFSLSQHDLLLSLHPSKNVLMAPFMLKDYGIPTVQKHGLTTFLAFGNIREYKRIDVLINASQDAYERTNKKFRVIIAGSCSEWEKYQKLIKYPDLFDLRIHRVENKDIPNLFGESHYFVTPYQDIAQSGSVIVAINYDCPIISSDLEAFREYIHNNQTGFLFKPADVEDLTGIITNILLTENADYERLRNNIIKVKEKEFSPNTITMLYKNFFDSL